MAYLGNGRIDVFDHGVRHRTRCQRGIVLVRTIGIDLVGHAQSGRLGGGRHVRVGHVDQRARRDIPHGLCNSRSQCRIARGHVVERAVGLYVMERDADRARHAQHGAHLVHGQCIDFGGGHRHGAAAKPLQVRQARMRAHGNAGIGGRAHGGEHHLRIPRMKAAGNVGGCDMAQDRFVIAHAPCAKAFAHVAIDVECRHCCFPGFIGQQARARTLLWPRWTAGGPPWQAARAGRYRR
ncbi:hypothetical protein D3C72_1494550 [compost metagenome]